MTIVSDQELTMTPLRGKSGKAFIGQYPNGEKIFIKFNTTPILPALAKEQIAPQLLWVRRTGNGDTMSAQEWLDGRILTKEDMGSKQIVHILLRLHKSRPLVNQLLQLNYKIENPYDLLVDWEKNAPLQIRENTYLQGIVKELKRSLPEFRSEVATLTLHVTHEFVHSAVNFVVNHFFWQFNDFSVCNSQFKRSTFNSIVKCDFFS